MPNLGGGGGERVVSILLNNIERTKFIPNLVLIKRTGSDAFVKNLKSDVIVHQLDVNVRIKFSFPIVIKKLIKLCKTQKPNVLFFGSGQINALISPFLFLFPSDIKMIARESNLPSIFEKYFIIKFFYKYCYSNYDSIIVQSDDMFQDLNKKFNIHSSKLIKINNPVDVAYIRQKLKEYKEVGFSENKINLLAAGRLTYQKGFDLLILQLAQIKNQEYFLTILGEGEEMDILKKLVRENNLQDNICFRGNVENPFKYMEKADAFVLSSRFEGFPNVILETLVCGTPVLANNCLGGINEIIESGFNGEVFSFENGDFEIKFNAFINSEYNRIEIKKDAIKRFGSKNKMVEFEALF